MKIKFVFLLHLFFLPLQGYAMSAGSSDGKETNLMEWDFDWLCSFSREAILKPWEKFVSSLRACYFRKGSRLLREYVVPDLRDRAGRTLFHFCIQFNSVEVARAFLENNNGEGRRFLEKKDNYGKTPLLYAVEFGCFDLINFLIEIGANIDVRCSFDRSILYYAVLSGDIDVVDFVLKLKNDTSFVNLIDFGRGTVLHLATKKGLTNIVKLLLEKGARESITKKNIVGLSPLHFAAKSGNLDAFLVLLKHGARIDIDQRDGFGKTPLDYLSKEDLAVVRKF